ncbi:hypothetical protein GGI43DRAFT_348115 [Trichoderma evansii]
MNDIRGKAQTIIKRDCELLNLANSRFYKNYSAVKGGVIKKNNRRHLYTETLLRLFVSSRLLAQPKRKEPLPTAEDCAGSGGRGAVAFDRGDARKFGEVLREVSFAQPRRVWGALTAVRSLESLLIHALWICLEWWRSACYTSKASCLSLQLLQVEVEEPILVTATASIRERSEVFFLGRLNMASIVNGPPNKSRWCLFRGRRSISFNTHTLRIRSMQENSVYCVILFRPPPTKSR